MAFACGSLQQTIDDGLGCKVCMDPGRDIACATMLHRAGAAPRWRISTFDGPVARYTLSSKWLAINLRCHFVIVGFIFEGLGFSLNGVREPDDISFKQGSVGTIDRSVSAVSTPRFSDATANELIIM
jgi:hypothetical protein